MLDKVDMFVSLFTFVKLLTVLLLYLQRVKDSWRVVNHRDIIPTVPRLMGYCHVERPVFLAAGVLRHALVSGYYNSLHSHKPLCLKLKYKNLLFSGSSTVLSGTQAFVDNFNSLIDLAIIDNI